MTKTSFNPKLGWVAVLSVFAVACGGGGSSETEATGEAEVLPAELRSRYAPRQVLAGRIGPCTPSPLLAPVFEGKSSINGEATLYICKDQTCGDPIVGAAAIRAALQS